MHIRKSWTIKYHRFCPKNSSGQKLSSCKILVCIKGMWYSIELYNKKQWLLENFSTFWNIYLDVLRMDYRL